MVLTLSDIGDIRLIKPQLDLKKTVFVTTQLNPHLDYITNRMGVLFVIHQSLAGSDPFYRKSPIIINVIRT